MERDREGLLERLEALFLKHPELLEMYLVNLEVVRDLKEGPLYERHLKGKEHIEKLAWGGEEYG